MLNFFNDTKIIIKYSVISIINIINNLINPKFYLIDINIWKQYRLLFTKLTYNKFLFINRGELNKNFFFIFKIINYLLINMFTRNMFLVSLGGGVTGDIAGFISSIFLRGVRLIHIPTTVVSQIDSSIGGKNGVNLTLGKNLVGTVYQPLYILIAVEFLNTLNYYNYMVGYAEIIKIMIINCPLRYDNLINKSIYNFNKIILFFFKDFIHGKILILRRDLNDDSYRVKLNLGHTFAHALESYSNYKITHGVAVFIGLFLASLLSLYNYGLSFNSFFKIFYVLRFWFPSIFLNSLDNILSLSLYFSFDKKRLGSLIKILIIKKIGKVLIKNISIIFLVRFCRLLFIMNELIKVV